MAHGEEEDDLLRQEATSHERQGPRRRVVQPMGVINNSKERPPLGRLGQQAEDGQSDQERIRLRAGIESKRDGESLVLGLRETVGLEETIRRTAGWYRST